MPSAVAERLSANDLARALLRHDHWDTPRAILDAVFRPYARVAVKACHASSKTFTAADAVVLALLAGADVLTTAPTWEQVRTVLWGHIHRAMSGAVPDLSSWDISQTEIRTPSGAVALGLSTNEGVRFQGWHARPGSFLLIVLDEAPGVRPDIYEAVEGISAGGDVRLLLLGNPVIASGPFYDIFAGDAAGWERFTIDAFDTPNLRGLSLSDLLALDAHQLDVSPRPYLVTRRWVRDRYAEWGEDHPLWQSRVRGQFPLQSDDSLISLAWLEAAAARPAEYVPGLPLIGGLDVAGPGEAESVLVIRQGSALLETQAFPHADARGEVLAALLPWRHRGLAAVNVDVAGIGHYLAAHLADNGVPVRAVNVGARPTSDDAAERHVNLKAELYWGLRERFREGSLDGLTDRVMLAQLAGLRYEHTSSGKVLIEPKIKARARGVRSPDRAEALMLAFAPLLEAETNLAHLYSRPLVMEAGHR